ncbi:accessory Sec system protein Asp2 [Streptococcus himalayensis]|uniref:Accessory Sec system protein Asp2 n=1 Tax=Streptococcus himalayensis TaxID=1888195 RepID=A0A917A828_9STRE|nr:accessory Sec system protein Asp2 [Streptococcus himalayensis]
MLQIGHHNWQDEAEIPENIDWIYLQPQEILSFLEAENKKLEARYQKEKAKFPKKEGVKRGKIQIDGIILPASSYSQDLLLLESIIEPYRVFFPEDLETTDPVLQTFLARIFAQAADFSDKASLLQTFSKIFFKGQFGQKIAISDFAINPDAQNYFHHYEGNAYLVLDGEYGEDYKAIGSYVYGVPYYKEAQIELWQEFIKDPTCEVKIRVSHIPEGALASIIAEWEFKGEELELPNVIDLDKNGTLFVTIFVKGQGRLQLGSLHYRRGRGGFGQFSLGGQRFFDSQRQEFSYFFHPGDFKPPLCVYFSGWRTAEGFEGYGMMRKLGAPMLLICDSRITGGSFYLGTKEFENKISDVIQMYLEYLGFNNKQLIMSGMSMGTFGAVYHGANLDPHAFILAKPVFSLGRVAELEKTLRPGGFPASLDILLHLEGGMEDAAARRLDKRFWDVCVNGRYQGTKFFIAYMKDDDYDKTAFRELVEGLSNREVQIVGRGWTGRHMDGSSFTVPWFLNQYQKVLETDFGRGEQL